MIKTFTQLEQLGNVKPFNMSDLSANIFHGTIYESVDIYDNIVSIETKNGIVHTKWDSFRDIYIVPMKKVNLKLRLHLCARNMKIRTKRNWFFCVSDTHLKEYP